MASTIAFPAMVKELRLNKNLTMEQLAEELGKTKSTISKWEKGTRSPKIYEIEEIAKFFGVEPKKMMFGDNSTPIAPQVDLIPSTLQKITSTSSQLEQPRQEKVLSFANEQLEEQNNVISMFDRKVEETENYITDYVEGLVAAGLGAYQEDNLHMEVKLRADDVPDKYDTIAKVAGNSMEPLIQDNDLLFIKVSSQVDMNDIGIFQVNGKNFVKKLKRDYDGAWYLQSLNKSYEEIYLSENDNIRTIGEVVDIYKEN